MEELNNRLNKWTTVLWVIGTIGVIASMALEWNNPRFIKAFIYIILPLWLFGLCSILHDWMKRPVK